MIYKVRMRLTWERPKGGGRNARNPQPPMTYADCLVEADDIEQAGRIGDDFIQGSARVDMRLTGAELISIASVRLPMTI